MLMNAATKNKYKNKQYRTMCLVSGPCSLLYLYIVIIHSSSAGVFGSVSLKHQQVEVKRLFLRQKAISISKLKKIV